MTKRTENGYFYAEGIFCYGTTACTSTTIDWVRDFDVAQNASLIIVLSEDVGPASAGVYARVTASTTGGVGSMQWRFVVPYADYIKRCSAINSIVKVYANVDASVTPGPNDHVYRNGQLQEAGASIEPSIFDYWAQIIPLEADASKVVLKEAAAATSDVIQLSDGSRKIKDWVPPAGGIIKVDPAGKPDIAVPGTDYSLPVDLVPKNVTPADATHTDTDPSVELTVGGSSTHTFKFADIKSGGGFKLGSVFVDFV